MEKKLSASEANIELNKQLEDTEIHLSKESRKNASAANMEIQREFYGSDSPDGLLPTYMQNDTPAIKVTGDDK